jgi:hypothetical protein
MYDNVGILLFWTKCVLGSLNKINLKVNKINLKVNKINLKVNVFMLPYNINNWKK